MRFLIGALILAAVIALGIAAFEAGSVSPARSNGPAHGVVWAGQTFATRADFARWLRSQGTTYRSWARRHPVEAGLAPKHAPNGGQQHSGWGAGVWAGLAAFLAALAFGVAYVRRRWPASDAFVPNLIRAMGLRCAEAIKTAARTTRRWAALAARRSKPVVSAAAVRAADLIEVMGLRGAAAARAGARTMRRWAALAARRSKPRATTATLGAARWLEVVALRGAAAAGAGARRTRRWAALTAHHSSALATAPAFGDRRRRSELAWYVTTALIAAGMGVVVTVWLNGG
jgi:hypothetical protein